MFASEIREVKQTASEKFRLFLIALITTDNWVSDHTYGIDIWVTGHLGP